MIPIDSGRGIPASGASTRIRSAIISGALSYTTIQLSESQRLDTIAGQVYGRSSLWWIIAAASGIGWGLQVPAGTILSIPSSPGAALRMV
tara:strand:- start:1739 stop:2008 length:270 start_codon:yes stop_codon:yes gene_type:complete